MHVICEQEVWVTLRKTNNYYTGRQSKQLKKYLLKNIDLTLLQREGM